MQRQLAAGRAGHDRVDGLVLQGLALDHDLVAGRAGAQRFFLELRLLHQPMDEPAQQQRLGAPALEPAGPQPGVVRQELGDPALAHTLEDEQRPIRHAGHQDLAVLGLDVELAEPAPPFGLAGPAQVGGHGVARPSSVTTGL